MYLSRVSFSPEHCKQKLYLSFLFTSLFLGLLNLLKRAYYVPGTKDLKKVRNDPCPCEFMSQKEDGHIKKERYPFGASRTVEGWECTNPSR